MARPLWLRPMLGSFNQASASVLINAPPQAVYGLVSDVSRMGEWSPECYRCKLLDAVEGPVVGARFRGYDRRGWIRWSMYCQIVDAVPGQAFAFQVAPKFGRVQSLWRYTMEPTGNGTLLTESFETLWYFRLVVRLLFGGSRRRRASLEANLRRTLDRIKVVAEAQA